MRHNFFQISCICSDLQYLDMNFLITNTLKHSLKFNNSKLTYLFQLNRMSSYLIQDPKYSFLKDLGLSDVNHGNYKLFLREFLI